MLKSLVLLLAFLCLSLAEATELSLLTLNLHGLHPMGEQERFLQDQNGQIKAAPSFLHYFSMEEIIRGHQRQINHLSSYLLGLNLDMIALQEVAGGHPFYDNGCEEFYQRAENSPWENTALKLQRKLYKKNKTYQLFMACRGNRGWRTHARSFSHKRVVKRNKKGALEVVHDFASNPYPFGLHTEGMAILVADHLEVVDHRLWNENYNSEGDRYFWQSLTVNDHKQGKWFVVVNIHGGHKLAHFEQALTIRKKMSEYIKQSTFRGEYAGLIILGDFNARLYQRSRANEISTLPFEIQREASFDFSSKANQNQLRTKLFAELNRLNFSKYKPWASVTNLKRAQKRITEATEKYLSLLQETHASLKPLKESLLESQRFSKCYAASFDPIFQARCFKEERIDLTFFSSDFTLMQASVLFSNNNWQDLSGVSDHPGLYSVLKY